MITRETGVGSALQPKYTGQGDGSFKGIRILHSTVANEKHIQGFFLLVPPKMCKYGTGPTPPVSNWTPPNTECDQVC